MLFDATLMPPKLSICFALYKKVFYVVTEKPLVPPMPAPTGVVPCRIPLPVISRPSRFSFCRSRTDSAGDWLCRGDFIQKLGRDQRVDLPRVDCPTFGGVPG